MWLWFWWEGGQKWNSCENIWKELDVNEICCMELAYAYRLRLFLGERSERNTAYGMSLKLWTTVIPEYCAILKSVIISFAYNSFQNCSNSILTTVFSRKRMLRGIKNYLWHLNKMLVENFSHIHVFIYTCFMKKISAKLHNQWFSHIA